MVLSPVCSPRNVLSQRLHFSCAGTMASCKTICLALPCYTNCETNVLPKLWLYPFPECSECLEFLKPYFILFFFLGYNFIFIFIFFHFTRIVFLFFFFFLLLFICAYKDWFISPHCPHPLPYHPLRPLPLPPPQYPAETILHLFLILL
jgi:hypothetical protein